MTTALALGADVAVLVHRPARVDIAMPSTSSPTPVIQLETALGAAGGVVPGRARVGVAGVSVTPAKHDYLVDGLTERGWKVVK